MTAAKRQESMTAEFSYMLTPEQAVALYKLVAASDYKNGLAGVYMQLGDLVRDHNGHVPGHIDYTHPAWALVSAEGRRAVNVG